MFGKYPVPACPDVAAEGDAAAGLAVRAEDLQRADDRSVPCDGEKEAVAVEYVLLAKRGAGKALRANPDLPGDPVLGPHRCGDGSGLRLYVYRQPILREAAALHADRFVRGHLIQRAAAISAQLGFVRRFVSAERLPGNDGRNGHDHGQSRCEQAHGPQAAPAFLRDQDARGLLRPTGLRRVRVKGCLRDQIGVDLLNAAG